MLISAFFCRLCIPVDGFHFFLNFFTVKIIESYFPFGQLCKLQIADIVDISGIFQYSRNVRCKIAFAACYTDNHRTVFSGSIDLTGIFLEHDSKCIRTTDSYKSVVQSIYGSSEVLLVVIIDQLNSYFCISL